MSTPTDISTDRFEQVTFFIPVSGGHFIDAVLFWDNVSNEISELGFSLFVDRRKAEVFGTFSVQFTGRSSEIIDITVRDRFGHDLKHTDAWSVVYWAVLDGLEKFIAKLGDTSKLWTPGTRPVGNSESAAAAFRHLYDVASLLELS